MPDLILPYDILNDTSIDAGPVQSNFTEIEQYVNTSVIHTDGAVSMAAPLRLFGDPVDPSDAVRYGFLNAILPLGVILPYSGIAAPGGQWAIANGASLSTVTYADLFAVCQYRYGGSGSSFNLPNFAGRVPIGQSGSAPFLTVGGTGGSKDAALPSHSHTGPSHTHTGPSHTHTQSTHSHAIGGSTSDNGHHTHNEPYGTGQFVLTTSTVFHAQIQENAAGPIGIKLGGTPYGSPTTAGAGGHTHTMPANTGATAPGETAAAGTGATGASGTGATSTAGVSATDANLPPYVVINYIIRVL